MSAFAEDAIPLYPLYAVMFADPGVTGLSPAAISSLFILWSLCSFVFEIPTGVLADRVPRRPLLVIGPLLTAAGFAAWTWWPAYLVFAGGFVLWAAGSALRSGTLQALIFDTLSADGRADRYTAVAGRVRAGRAFGVIVGTALAVPLAAAGGYAAVGAASVAACVLCAAASAMLPEAHPPDRDRVSDADADADGRGPGILRDALRQLWVRSALRRAFLLVIALTWVAALDEYLPLLAATMWPGGSATGVSMLMVIVAVGDVAGSLAAGSTAAVRRRPRVFAGWLCGGAIALAVGAGSAHPIGMLLVAFAFGVFGWSLVIADAMLAHRVSSSRATITSIAGVGEEMVAILAYGAWALGSQWLAPTGLFVAAAVPYVVVAVLVACGRGATTDRASGR
ncbi:MFS transporter [Gordonia sp. NPDC003424]